MKTQRISTLALALSALHLLPASVTAQSLTEYSSPLTSQSLTASPTPLMSQYRPWMSSDVLAAWKQGYQGQDQNITIIDDFKSRKRYIGKLQGFSQILRPGEWTALQASMIAPGATLRQQEFTDKMPLRLYSGLNVINMSYGVMTHKNHLPISDPREASIASYAHQGQAVVVKSAGNDDINMGGVTGNGKVDQLSRLLRGSPSGIFVGSLSMNGSKERLAPLSLYSNKAGKDAAYQNQFLVVGVHEYQMGLGGTSFAAPIVSGYAAILGSKFTTATPTQVTNLLLDTARTDTVANYSREVHGRGEASLSRALAPTAIR